MPLAGLSEPSDPLWLRQFGELEVSANPLLFVGHGAVCLSFAVKSFLTAPGLISNVPSLRTCIGSVPPDGTVDRVT